MKKWIFAILIFVFFTSAWAEDNRSYLSARYIIENWLAAAYGGQTELAASYLSPGFMSIHRDGIPRNKAEEIAYMKSLKWKDYQLTDFVFVEHGDVLIVSYKDMPRGFIYSQKYKDQTADRIIILKKTDGRWLILGYDYLMHF